MSAPPDVSLLPEPFCPARGRSPASRAPSPERAAAAEHADLTRLLRDMPARGAADLLLIAGWPPIYGVSGQWLPDDGPALRAEQIGRWLDDVLTPQQRDQLAAQQDLDFGIRLAGVGRFRINAHHQNHTPAAAIRAVPGNAPRIEDLDLPPHVARLAEFPHGLVLVTGGTGHGKSTTLAALIARLNETRACHVITLEDPVEFEFERGLAIIEQREIGSDSPSFAGALRHVVRQRPDVILVGEMRDLETISTALTAAETGHLVLASLHTCNTSQALARIIDVFPPQQQPYVRTQLAASLRAIHGQVLLPRVNGGLVPAVESLTATDGIRRAIRDNETHLIYGMLETGRSLGMCTLEQALVERVAAGQVDPTAARAAAAYPDRFDRLMAGSR